MIGKGAYSTVRRSRASLSRSASSARLRALISSMMAMQYAGLPAWSRCTALVKVDPDGVAVLVKVTLFQLECIDLSAHQGGESVQIGRKVFRVRQILKALLQKLGAAVPENLAKALVDPQPGAVPSDIADADGGVLERAAKTGLAFAQRVRSGQSGAMQAIQARGIPQQGGCQQRDGGQRDEPNLEVRPVEPGLLSRSEQPSEQYRAGHGNGQQHAGGSGTWPIAGEQGHPAGSGRNANAPRKRTTRPSAACRAIGVKKATDCRIPAPIR